LKSNKAELEWLESVENFSTLLMATHLMNNEHQGYDNLTWVILFNKYNTNQVDNILYREWLFDSEIVNPPLLNLQTEKVDQSSSTKSLAQLLKNIGVVGVIELPEFLSQKSINLLSNSFTLTNL